MDRDREQWDPINARHIRPDSPGVSTELPTSTMGGFAKKAVREQTAREVAADLMLFHQQKVDEVQALVRALPGEMPYRAEAALRGILQNELRRLTGR